MYKYFHVVLLVLATLFTGSVVAAPITEVSQQQLFAKIAHKEDFILLDVRSAAEFAQGHIEGAMNISHDEMAQAASLLEAYKHKEILIYCRSGRRAGIVSDELTRQGFTKLSLLKGHLLAWSEKNLPLVKD